MIKRITTLLLLILLSGCFANENNQSKEKNGTTPNSNKSNETKEISSLFTLKTIEGKAIHINESQGGLSFQEFKNKNVLFIFFGYKCPPCLKEVPELIKLQNEKHHDLEIVALEVQGLNEEKLKDFAKRKETNYHLVSGENNRKFIDYIIQKANWRGSIPFLLGFDKKGVVQIVHVGGINKEQFDKIYISLSKEDNNTISSKEQNISK